MLRLFAPDKNFPQPIVGVLSDFQRMHSSCRSTASAFRDAQRPLDRQRVGTVQTIGCRSGTRPLL
jgi:hypothetical protein